MSLYDPNPTSGPRALIYATELPIAVVEIPSPEAREYLERYGRDGIFLPVMHRVPQNFLRKTANPPGRMHIKARLIPIAGYLVIEAVGAKESRLLKAAFMPAQQNEARDDRLDDFAQFFMKTICCLPASLY